MLDANINIERGDVLIIVGPQGCGKSRLARNIASQYGEYQEVKEWGMWAPSKRHFASIIDAQFGMRLPLAVREAPLSNAIIWCVDADVIPATFLNYPVINMGEDVLELLGTWPARMIGGRDSRIKQEREAREAISMQCDAAKLACDQLWETHRREFGDLVPSHAGPQPHS